MIQLKRVYEKPEAHDGVRFLIERLWPLSRGESGPYEQGRRFSSC